MAAARRVVPIAGTPAGRRKLYERASENLREAEALASIQGVSGPADETPGDEDSYVRDYAMRAARALKRATEIASGGTSPVSVDRAKQIAKRVTDGARQVKAAVRRTKDRLLDPIIDAGQKLQFGAIAGGLVLTAILAFIAYRLFMR